MDHAYGHHIYPKGEKPCRLIRALISVGAQGNTQNDELRMLIVRTVGQWPEQVAPQCMLLKMMSIMRINQNLLCSN